jgi:hypothetical protein
VPGDGLDVRGGAGGVDARLDDLVAAGSLLRRCAAELADLAVALGRLVCGPAMQLTGLPAPVTLAEVDARTLAAVAGPHGLLPVAARLEALGTALGLVAGAYRGSDAVAAAAVHEAELTAGVVAGRLAIPLLPGLIGYATGTGVGSGIGAGDSGAHTGGGAGTRGSGAEAGGGGGGTVGPGRRLFDLMAGHGDVMEHVMAAAPGFLDGMVRPWPPVPASFGIAVAAGPLRDVPDAAALVGRFGRIVPGLSEPSRVEVRLNTGREVRPPRDLADLTGRVASCYPVDPFATGTATVRVDQVIGPGGRRAWVVAVPGQQQMSLHAGSNPFDLAGDVHAMARQDTASRQTVLKAMEVAGIPRGEPVLIAGHSQGGMIAAGLAADPAVRERYRITHVLTVGSPIGEYPVPDDVQVLAVEHTDDVVPRLDGRANPDRAGWVTVRRTLHVPGMPADAVAAHDLDRYRQTVALVDASDDPSLRAYRAGLEPFLDRPGAQGWSNEVSARRTGTGAP